MVFHQICWIRRAADCKVIIRSIFSLILLEISVCVDDELTLWTRCLVPSSMLSVSPVRCCRLAQIVFISSLLLLASS